jgi:hypothetical protein
MQYARQPRLEQGCFSIYIQGRGRGLAHWGLFESRAASANILTSSCGRLGRALRLVALTPLKLALLEAQVLLKM